MRISDWSSDVCSSDLGRERKRRDTFDLATDRGDTHQRLGNASYNHDVAWSGDRVAEQVEADADIADAGRRKRASLAAMLDGAHARSPRALAIATPSPKTPPPLPPGPPPGACTPREIGRDPGRERACL